MSASGARAYLAVVKAATGNPSAIPATPVMQKVNFSDIDMGASPGTTETNNISGTRRTQGVAVTSFEVGGGYGFEVTFENSLLDELIAGFLWSDWATNTIKDGSTYQPFFIERGHPDVAEYFQFMGMGCNVWTMEFKDQAMVTGKYDFVGMGSAVLQVPTTGATYTDATKNPVFSTVTNISDIKINNVAASDCSVKEWTLEVNNNLTAKTGVGKLGACATNAHKLQITLTLTAYFEDSSFYQGLLNGTEFSFGWKMTDDLGNSYTFLLPRCRISEDSIPVDGPDDIMEAVKFTALEDSATDCMIQIDKVTI